MIPQRPLANSVLKETAHGIFPEETHWRSREVPLIMQATQNPYWTPVRVELHQALSAVSASLAELYQGAVLMLYSHPIPGRMRFIAHAVREIRNRIPDEIAGRASSGPIQYENSLDNISKLWSKSGLSDVEEDNDFCDEPVKGNFKKRELPGRLFRAIEKLIRQHNQSRLTRRDQAKRLFLACGSETDKNLASIGPVIEQWLEITEWFVKNVHDSGKIDGTFDEKILVQKFEIFELTLLSLLGEFFSAASDQLDEILAEANLLPWTQPTSLELDRAVALLGHPANYRYFFNELNNPLWVQPLRQNYFKVPPEVDQDSSGKVTFPRWPESRYLSRMASHAPEVVSEVLMGIRDTDNIEVQEDVVRAALVLPANLSAQFVSAMKSWIESPYFGLPTLPMEIGRLLSHLAKGDEISASLELAYPLLRMTLRKRSQGTSSSSAPFSLPPELQGRFGTWEYEEILKRNIPDLVRASGIGAVELLCGLLEEAVRIKRGNQNESDAIDFSYIWRPAVEEHSQNYSHSTVDALISAVRDAVTSIGNDFPELVPDLVRILENRQFYIFRRLALHLLTQFPCSAPTLAAERIADPDFFDNHHVLHEYYHLCRLAFHYLSSQQANELLDRIRHGTDRLPIKRWIESDGTAASDEQLEQIIRHWRRDRLAAVKDHLSGGWAREYLDLVSEFGEPEHPDFSSWHESGSGPNSPLSPQALSNMKIDEIVVLMRTWNPICERRIEESHEGLGRAFSHVVQADPARFAANAAKFKNLDPTYVRSLFSGLEKGIRAGKAIEWAALIDLCQWAVMQPSTKRPREWRYEDRDPDWGWTRGEIADLLEAGLNSTVSPIPFDLKNEVWWILDPITNDPDPHAEDERSFDGEKRDPLMDSWNTTRGKALRTVINYAVWVKASIIGTKQQELGFESGLEVMPDVERVLDEHLIRDPSLAIRSVYGQWLPWLIWIDRTWTEKKLSIIFPRERELRDYWQVAWESYVKLNEVRRSVFDLMRDEYERAIANIGAAGKDHYFGEDPDDALATHLMTVYWHGGEDIEKEASLVREFFEKAHPQLRAHALFLIGRSLHKHVGDLSAELANRLMKLWAWLISRHTVEAEEDSQRNEFSAFGWWFTSGQLDLEWTLVQLNAAVKICGRIKNSDQVMERLKLSVGRFPTHVAECLLSLVEGAKEIWELHYWQEDAYAALEAVCQTENVEAIRLARKTANLFGERGFRMFKTLCQADSAQ